MNHKEIAAMLRQIKITLTEAEGLFVVGEKGRAANKIKDAKVILESIAEELEKPEASN
jgi:hypothetical protein